MSTKTAITAMFGIVALAAVLSGGTTQTTLTEQTARWYARPNVYNGVHVTDFKDKTDDPAFAQGHRFLIYKELGPGSLLLMYTIEEDGGRLKITDRLENVGEDHVWYADEWNWWRVGGDP